MDPSGGRRVEGVSEILNVGNGSDTYGSVRMDVYPTKATNLIADMETDFPFRADSFDIVHSRYTFEHLRNPGHMVKEAFRVLKPGGQIYILTNNAWFWRYPWGIAKEHSAEYDQEGRSEDHHYALFLPWHLRPFLLKEGFVNVETGFDGWSRKLDRAMKSVGLARFGAQNVFARGIKPQK